MKSIVDTRNSRQPDPNTGTSAEPRGGSESTCLRFWCICFMLGRTGAMFAWKTGHELRLLAVLTATVVCMNLPVASAQNAEERPTFRDVTKASGIEFLHTNGRAGELFVVEVKGSGVAFIDYDNDGDLDIYAVNGNNLPGAQTDVPPINDLYRNDGDGHFTRVTDESGTGDGGYGHGVAVADYDNDGDQDMYVANYGPNVLYRNNGDGSFSDVTAEAGVAGNAWTASAAFCDLDNDGFLDLYVANYLVFDIKSSARLPTGPGFYEGEADVLYLNNGDGTFRDVTEESVGSPTGKGLGVVCFDYDNDGDLEIYVANDGVDNLMYENRGDATFEDVTLFSGAGVNGAGEVEAGMGVDAGDYDNDGDFDLFVTNYKGQSNTLLRNDGGGIFTDTTSLANLTAPSLPYVTFGTGFFDYDNDSDLDLFVANGHTEEDVADHEQPDQLFENTGDGVYEDVSADSGAPFQAKHVGRGVAFGDYDNDGDIDIVVSNKNGPLTLLQNEGGHTKNWLLIRTVGKESNRDGIGARIQVMAEEFSREKEVKTSYSMFSASDPRTHFGLGDIEEVDVTVRWPSGIVDKLVGIPANRLLVVEEGAGEGRVVVLTAMDTAYGELGTNVVETTAVDSASIESAIVEIRGMIESRSLDTSRYLVLAPSYLAWMAQRTEERYLELLEGEPENAALWSEYAFFLRYKLRNEDAIGALYNAAAASPDDMRIHAALAGFQLRLGYFEDAVASAQRAIELGDSSAGNYLRLGQALAEVQRPRDSEVALLEVTKRYPRLVEGYLQLGQMYARSDQIERSLEVYSMAVRLDPAAREPRYQLAEVYRRMGNDDRYDSQMQAFRLLETESAVFKGGMDRTDEIDLLHREILVNPLFGRTRADRQLALRYGEIGDTENQTLFSVRGRLSTVKDDMAMAVDAVRRLLETDSSSETRALFDELQDFRSALVAAFNDATGYDAGASAEKISTGESALDGGDYDAALMAFRNALRSNPDNAAAFRGLARVYLEANLSIATARDLARKAALIDQSAESYRLLADIYETIGDRDAAARALLMTRTDGVGTRSVSTES